MIQDIAPHRLYNQYQPKAVPSGDSVILYYTEMGILCRLEKQEGLRGALVRFPLLKEFPEYAEKANTETKCGGQSLIYLFRLDSRSFFLLNGSLSEAQLPAGFSLRRMQELRELPSGTQSRMFAAATGLHLWHWYRDNRFCGRCGQPTEPDQHERALRCRGCGSLIFPKLCPAVIVGVLHRDRILVTKYRQGYAHYALVAGFAEIGETLEEAAAREVMEETGLRIKHIRYYKSQPWGFADDLLAGFFCEVDGSADIRLDTNELKLAEWQTREEVELQPDDMSLTNEMMQQFKEGMVSLYAGNRLAFETPEDEGGVLQ